MIKEKKFDVTYDFDYKKLEDHQTFEMMHPDPAIKNSTAYCYFQTGKSENQFLDYASNALLFTLLKHPAFNTLRTQEQLGYIVHTIPMIFGGHIGGYMVVHSSHKDPDYLLSRINNFLSNSSQFIDQITDEEFE